MKNKSLKIETSKDVVVKSLKNVLQCLQLEVTKIQLIEIFIFSSSLTSIQLTFNVLKYEMNALKFYRGIN